MRRAGWWMAIVALAAITWIAIKVSGQAQSNYFGGGTPQVQSLLVGSGSLLPGSSLGVNGPVVGGTLQATIQNTSADNAASSDWIATCDDGSNTTCYVDLGINSSTYNQAGFSSGAHGDGYLYVQGGSANAGGNLAIGTASSGKVLTFFTGGTTSANVRATVSNTAFTASVPVSATAYVTASNCAVNSVSPGACGSAAAGAFVIPTLTTTYTVNTSAVTANSVITLTPRTYAGNLPSSPTCVAPLLTAEPTVSAIVAATSFDVTLTSTTGQTCWNYTIVN